jgi:drug/metabolite transporter (DMT)-like permease
MRASASDVVVGGVQLAWWVPIAELAVVAAAFAYAAGIGAVRHLGATMASFLMLTEVLFAIALAWLLLGELPRAVQLVGGLLIVAGVVAVRVEELRLARAPQPADFAVPTPVP